MGRTPLYLVLWAVFHFTHSAFCLTPDHIREASIRAFNDARLNEKLVLEELLPPEICVAGVKHFVGCIYAAEYIFNLKLMGQLDDQLDYLLDFANQPGNGYRGKQVAKVGSDFALYKRIPSPIPFALGSITTSDRDSQLIKRYNEKKISHYSQFHNAIKAFFQAEVITYSQQVETLLDVMTDPLQQKAGRKKLKALGFKVRKDKNIGALTHWAPILYSFPQRKHAFILSELYNQYLKNSSDGKSGLKLSSYLKIHHGISVIKDYNGIDMSFEKWKGRFFVFPKRRIIDEKTKIRLEPRDEVLAIFDDKKGKLAINSQTSKAQFTKWAQGEPDSWVTLNVRKWRDGSKHKIRIRRVNVNSSGYDIKTGLRWNNQKFGVLKLSTFMNPFPRQRVPILCNLATEEMGRVDHRVDGWIIDLRNNLGGLKYEAECLLDLIHPTGVKLVGSSEVLGGQTSEPSDYYISHYNPVTDKPLVILINGLSASASELVAGASQETGRAFIVGSTSFGKGSIQTQGYTHHPIFPGEHSFADVPMLKYKVTTGYYHFPSGKTPEGVGIIPDIEVLESPTAKRQAKIDIYATHPWGPHHNPMEVLMPKKSIPTAMSNCLKANRSKVMGSYLKRKPFEPDYQILTSLSVLRCQIGQQAVASY